MSSISARIHPTDKNLPDCMCILVLTERHLFIIEDNYDGTFTDHYVIGIKYIEDIIESAPDVNMEKPAPGSAADLSKGVDADIYRQKALGRLHRYKRSKKYLEIIYKDIYFERQHLFFDECDKPPKVFINAFQKYRSKHYEL